MLREVSFARFKNVKHEIVTKCSCGKQFIAKLNFRQHYRKPVTLVGQFMNLNSEIDAWTPAKILDLSMGGLRLQMEFTTNVRTDDTLRVRFKLDGKKTIAINKQVNVRFIDGNTIGCEFIDLALEEKELGFYLLNV